MSKQKIHRDNFSIGKPYGHYDRVGGPDPKTTYIVGTFYSWPYAVEVYAEKGYASFRIYHSGRIFSKTINDLSDLPSNVWLSRQANIFSKELISGQ